MNLKLAAIASLSALAIVSSGMTSCMRVSKSVSSSARMDTTVNGKRTITKKADEVTRKLEATAGVELKEGRITVFPKGALVKLEETGSATPRVAEVRENAGAQELWVNEGGTFRRGTAEEEAWLAEFLKDVVGD